jgi:hypothetical protein
MKHNAELSGQVLPALSLTLRKRLCGTWSARVLCYANDTLDHAESVAVRFRRTAPTVERTQICRRSNALLSMRTETSQSTMFRLLFAVRCFRALYPTSEEINEVRTIYY